MTLRRVDLALLVILLPAWLLCAVLSGLTLTRPSAHSPLYVTAAASGEDYPVVAGFWDTTGVRELRLGDRLLRFGTRDLRGCGGLATHVAFRAAASDAGGAVAVEFERGGERRSARVEPYPHEAFRAWLPVSALFVATAVFILVRTGGAPLGRSLFLSFMAIGMQLAIFWGSSESGTYAMIASRSVALGLALPLTLRAFQRFPDDPPGESAWSHVWPWLFALAGLFHAGRFGLMPHTIAVPAVLALTVGSFLAALWILGRRYRHADAIGRRRIRWVVFGVYAALLPPVVGNALASWDVRFTPLYTASLVSLGFIPLSVLISIWRVNLLDVDRLLSTTAAWNVLLVVGVGAMFVLMPLASQAASSWLHIEPQLSQAVVAILLLALLAPRQARVRAEIERQLFAERYALDRGAAQLQQELAKHGDGRALIECLGRGLSKLFGTESSWVFTRDGGLFRLIFTTGSEHEPFDASGPLALTLQERDGPRAIGLHEDEELDSFDRAALESLLASVVVPIVQDGDLRFVVCLGEKRSGDVYTRTDLNLLSMLTAHTSAQLVQCDQATLIGQLREMSDALRDYVPPAIAAQIERGETPEPGEREVTVMFADIRGYTGLAEQQKPEDTYSMVTAYTEMATQAVRRYGGHLIDFSGDSIMAVFGAPQDLEHKECAAVDVALEIVARARTIGVAGEGAKGALSVGIGIATGPAFTGPMPSAEQSVWVVIGKTTNRASRLQELTRTFDASIAIDDSTARASAERVRQFRKQPAVELRGHRQPADVWVLPL